MVTKLRMVIVANYYVPKKLLSIKYYSNLDTDFLGSLEVGYGSFGLGVSRLCCKRANGCYPTGAPVHRSVVPDTGRLQHTYALASETETL